MRTILSILAGTLLVTGCIFPSFDDMQNGASRANDDRSATETNPTENTVKRAELGADASADGAAATTTPAPATDAGADVDVAPPPGAGKVSCGGSDCTVSSSTYCCAGYVSPAQSCRNHDSFDAELGCANGIAHALFCDEKADCPNGQLCCHDDAGSGGIAKCAASCGGTVMCKTDADCPNNRRCNGGPLATDVPHTVCGP
jgi:hypothetical protein